LVASILAAGLLLGACGSDPPRELAGYVRDPAPVVAEISLPDVSRDGEPFAFRASPGSLLIVYFGYTNCPDVCPTTLADIRTALRGMDPEQAERIELAMVTVDPDRDTPVLTEYVQTFVDDAHALATDDPAALRRAADPFGVSYAVEVADDGSIEVAHSSQTFVVDDQGRLVLTWQFGIPADDLRADLEQLLDASEASA
jgi:protein SCO1/2